MSNPSIIKDGNKTTKPKRRRRTIDTREWKKAKTSQNTFDNEGFRVPSAINRGNDSSSIPENVLSEDTKLKLFEERARMRAEARKKREMLNIQKIDNYDQDKELKTLMQLVQGDQNRAAAKDEICDQVFFWARVYDVFSLYCHSEHGFEAPMEYDEEKRQLMEKTPRFSIPLKIESD